MATGINMTTDITAVIPTVLSPARDVVEQPTFMTEMVSKVPLKDGDGNTYNWPKFGDKLSAQTLTEGVPIANPQKLIPSSQQFTVSEVGLEIIMTDKMIRRTPEAMKARAGRFAGNAMKRKREQDLLGLFAGASRDLGTAGNAFNPAFISAANVRLEAASESGADEPAPRPYSAVLHPFHYHDILQSAATLGSNINTTSGYMPIEGLTEELIRKYKVRELYDVMLATNALIPVDGSDDAVSGIFSKEAFLLVNTAHMMKTETERDIHLRAWDMVITSEYGTGEVEDQWHFAVTADATAPTS